MLVVEIALNHRQRNNVKLITIRTKFLSSIRGNFYLFISRNGVRQVVEEREGGARKQKRQKKADLEVFF